MSLAQPTHLFFDVDGVLIEGWHSNPTRRRPWDSMLKQDMGIEPQTLKDLFFHTTFLDALTGQRDTREALAEALRAMGSPKTAAEVMDYWFHKDSVVNTAVLEVVTTLQQRNQYQLYLATGQEHYRASYLMEDLGFKAYFKDIFYSARLGVLKTQPQFFTGITQELGVAANQCLLIDDAQPVITAAEKAGWQGILFEEQESLESLLK